VIWRARIRRWLGPALVIALLGGLLWVAVRYVGEEGAGAAAARLDEAMSKAAHQREITP
jgi:hypothetical protein